MAFPKPSILALFRHKLEQLAHQIMLLLQALLSLQCAGLPAWQVNFWQLFRAQAVPNAVKLAQTFWGLEPIQKCFQLGLVYPVFLGVYVPNEGLAGPQGPHQRVFASHKIEVTLR